MRLRTDLTGTGRTVTLRLDSTRRTPVTVTDRGRTISVGVKLRWKPWRIATADLNGDGRREIVVALHKSTRYLQEPHNCLFVYRYDGTTVRKVWLGSSVGAPFTDFAFARAAHGRSELLVTLDIGLDGSRAVTVHRWIGFGFRAEPLWGHWKSARLLGVRNGKIEVLADGHLRSRPLEVNR